MKMKDYLITTALNETDQSLSTQTMVDWLRSRANQYQSMIDDIIDGSHQHDDHYIQIGKYSVLGSVIKEVMDASDIQDSNQDDLSYTVYDISTNDNVVISGDDLVTEMRTTLESNEVLACAFEALGGNVSDTSSLLDAFTNRVHTNMPNLNPTTSTTVQTIQGVFMQGTTTHKDKFTNIIQMLTVSGDPGNVDPEQQTPLECDFSDYTGATPYATWGNIWNTYVKGFAEQAVQMVGYAIQGIFGIAGGLMWAAGKAIYTAWNVALNPQNVKAVSNTKKGTLNSFVQALQPSRVTYTSSMTLSPAKGILKYWFQRMHDSSSFRLNTYIIVPMPGVYLISAISEWVDENNFTAWFSIAPKIGDSDLLHQLSVVCDVDAQAIMQLDPNSVVTNFDTCVASCDAEPVDMSELSNNRIVQKIYSSYAQFMTYLCYGLNERLDPTLPNYETCLSECVRSTYGYMPTSASGGQFNRVRSGLYSWFGFHLPDTTAYPSSDGVMSPTNLDYLNLIRWFTPDVNQADTGNLFVDSTKETEFYNFWHDFMWYPGGPLNDYLDSSYSVYAPRVWMGGLPSCQYQLRNDKTIAAIYTACLAGAIASAVVTAAVAIKMRLNFKIKQRAYLARAQADSQAWDLSENRLTNKQIWKANKRASRLERWAGTASTDSTSVQGILDSIVSQYSTTDVDSTAPTMASIVKDNKELTDNVNDLSSQILALIR